MRTDTTSPRPPSELYRTEWCFASRRVRQRLTELGATYVIRRVPVEREKRTALLLRTGSDSIPALVHEGDDVLVGEKSIFLYLGERFPGPAAERMLSVVESDELAPSRPTFGPVSPQSSSASYPRPQLPRRRSVVPAVLC